LKEERNSALMRIQHLEEELSKVNDRMRQDISKLRDYSQLRMEMRESIYKEEIQHLITSFNKNYELNHGLLEGLIKEKYDYEHEIEELKESNQEYITHQEANFERIITEMENHKKLVDEELQDSNEKLKERERVITELNDQLDTLNAEAQQLRDANRELAA
jgi:chromosome segregation ATPase